MLPLIARIHTLSGGLVVTADSKDVVIVFLSGGLVFTADSKDVIIVFDLSRLKVPRLVCDRVCRAETEFPTVFAVPKPSFRPRACRAEVET